MLRGGKSSRSDELVRARISDRVWGWLAPIAVTIIGGLISLYQIDRPRWLVFDETYYVKEGASMIKYGYERSTKEGLKEPDKLWNTGNTDVWGTTPDFVVHPPTGKWLIGFGEALFGVTNPIGWRFASWVVGTLSILMIARIGSRLFGSILLGTTAGLLLTVDGQHFVHSRTGLLDGFVMFFALASFGFLLLDRDQYRARQRSWRPWLVAMGVSLGLCASTKWSGLFFAAAFSTAAVFWSMGSRRHRGQDHWWLRGLIQDGVTVFVHVIPIMIGTYLASWTGWFLTSGGYNRQWADSHPATGWTRIFPDPLRSLADYHRQMWDFNTTLHAFHSYMSNPWSWIVQSRPTSFDYRDVGRGEYGCPYEKCTMAITDLGNPVIWWAGTIAVGVLLVRWALARDWRAGAVLLGLIGGYLPWFLYQERTIYTFYSVAFVPWVVLAVTYCLGLILGPPGSDPHRRLVRGGITGTYVVTAVAIFAFFYPVLSDQPILHSQWQSRQWMSSWWWPAPDPASTTPSPSSSGL